MEIATTTPTTKKLKRPRNCALVSEKNPNGSKRPRHASATATVTNTANGKTTEEKQLLAKLAEMQNMFSSQLLLLRQDVTRRLDILQEKVDQLIVEQKGGAADNEDVDTAAPVATATIANHTATTNAIRADSPSTAPSPVATTNTATTTTVAPVDAPQMDPRPAVLMERPKSLDALWNEYENGAPDRKPAKLFNHTERGKVKHIYTRRKVFWDTVSVMVHQQGYSAESAIEAIHREYGDGPDCSVSKILQRMLKKRTNARNELQRKGMKKSRIDTEVMTSTIPANLIPLAAPGRPPPVPQRETRPATISKKPKDLYVLWEEYETGLNGAKPAKLFTATERGGKIKYNYYKRRVFWDAVSTMIREESCTVDAAIDRIYQEYGGRHVSVTKLLQAMIRKRTQARQEQDHQSNH